MANEYRMMQIHTTVTIPDFKITDRHRPFDEYIQWYRLKLLKEPTDFHRYSYAKALFYDMQTKEAKYILGQCNPNEPVTQFMLSVPTLLEGDYRTGLPLREYRLQAAKFPLHNIAPQWDGQPTDKKIIIWQEGGFGDVIQYARYLPRVLERAPNAKVVIDKALFPLIKHNYTESILKFNPHDFELQCSLMSLPHLLEDYEPNISTYLTTPDYFKDKWKHYEGKTGFVWRGNPLHSSDPLRSLTPEEAQRLSFGKGWVSLEPQDTGAENWADTAGILINLKRVVMIDSGVGHLAGALGVPVWTLMNKHHDWRWSREWYNSMRLFRCKEHSDWEPVFRQVEMALDEPVQAVA